MKQVNQLRLVEIEVYNYCNRLCSFCPNSITKDRYNKLDIKTLNFDSFKKMIDELYKHNFNGVFSFSRYNEPLAYPDITKKYIDYIRSLMDNKIVTNTNGDYINAYRLSLFDEVTIMDYDNKGAEYWIDKLYRTGYNTVSQEDDEFLYFKNNIKNHIVSVMLNFKENATIEDRGGVINDDTMKSKNNNNIRNRRCDEPMYFLGIDYNGSVMPCCNLRHDLHPSYIMGNINDSSILDILNSDKRINFINIMDKDNTFINTPCERCQKDPGRYTRDNPGIEYEGERK